MTKQYRSKKTKKSNDHRKYTRKKISKIVEKANANDKDRRTISRKNMERKKLKKITEKTR